MLSSVLLDGGIYARPKRASRERVLATGLVVLHAQYGVDAAQPAGYLRQLAWPFRSR